MSQKARRRPQVRVREAKDFLEVVAYTDLAKVDKACKRARPSRKSSMDPREYRRLLGASWRRPGSALRTGAP